LGEIVVKTVPALQNEIMAPGDDRVDKILDKVPPGAS